MMTCTRGLVKIKERKKQLKMIIKGLKYVRRCEYIRTYILKTYTYVFKVLLNQKYVCTSCIVTVEILSLAWVIIVTENENNLYSIRIYCTK